MNNMADVENMSQLVDLNATLRGWQVYTHAHSGGNPEFGPKDLPAHIQWCGLRLSHVTDSVATKLILHGGGR